MKNITRSLLFLLLTILTQVGGLIYLVSLSISPYFIKQNHSRAANVIFKFVLFISLYLGLSATVIPFAAAKFGRVPMPVYQSESGLHPNNILTCILNRHYVRKELLKVLVRASDQMKAQNKDIQIFYMDASFPFVNGFPLLPHWSHNDGKKIDLTYYYIDKKTKTTSQGSPSWNGYGFCEVPMGNEVNTTCECLKKGYYQYDLLRHLVPASLHDEYEVSLVPTSQLIRLIANDPAVSMIFIEPHLKQRWHLTDIDKIKFHGCHAVRHDDHIHIQIK